ncbi:hypothetical protein [Streptomyces gibsoniae]|uniref:DNA primase n=1 Tax=Streptomyces gibsoniae TaxID=3075529 RepID=A0ABU2TNQ3_9ACTN|nr:hypothetical protein [Streptomyces sp. DSM 41699]MDT0462575.1 hypothetical protein [Streptomyces sp. DSM 41699]
MINPKIAAAVLAGYLLGRTRKAKLALSLGAMLAGSKVKPDQLGKLLQDSPLVGNVSEQVRTELADAGKTAATTLLTAKAESLADALHERTTGLKERAYGGDEEREEDEGERAESRTEGRRTGARKSQASRSAARQKKTQTRAPGQGGEGRSKKAPAKKASSAQGRAKSGSARSRRPDDG